MDPHQPAEVSPPRQHAVKQAFAAYANAEVLYHRVTQCRWPRRPVAPDLRVQHLWRKVEITKQQWLALARV
jgi:hypothetical protein